LNNFNFLKCAFGNVTYGREYVRLSNVKCETVFG